VAIWWCALRATENTSTENASTNLRGGKRRYEKKKNVQRLQLLNSCRSRAAAEPRRRIFDTEAQSTGNAAGARVAFADKTYV